MKKTEKNIELKDCNLNVTLSENPDDGSPRVTKNKQVHSALIFPLLVCGLSNYSSELEDELE